MVAMTYAIAWGIMAIAAIGFAGIAVRIKRHREFPGQPSFLATVSLTAALLAVLTVLFIVVRLEAMVPLPIVVFVGAFALGLTIPLVWVRFTLQYTGQRFPTGRWTFFRLGIPVLITFAIIAGTMLVGFLNFGLGLHFLSEEAFAILDGILNYSTALTVFYLGALMVVGASLIAWTSYSFRHLSNRGGVLLGIGILIPWAAVAIPEAAGLFEGQPLLGNYHVALGGIVGLVATGSAIEQYDLFSQVPAAGTIGRDVTVEEMNEPIMVTDRAGRVIDLNAAAEDAFQTTIDAIGSPMSAVLNGIESKDLLSRSDGGEIGLGQRTFAPTASELRDEYDRVLGHSFVFHDVTERKQREQRIQVLNRVLRHNLRNDLNAVNGYAELAAESEDPAEHLIRIQETATDLISIGEKARAIEEVVASKRQGRAVTLSSVIEKVVGDVGSMYPEATIQRPTEIPDVDVDEAILSSVLRELLENAFEHNDAEQAIVDIQVTVDSNSDLPVNIEVSDNGPGIPPHELEPILQGTETSLEHGSGLGLWLVTWGVQTLNGEIDFRENDSRGTVVTISLPGPV